MENQEIRQYLINFAEKTLNKCEAFTKVYGKDFVRKRLEKNLEKVYTDISSSNPNTALYDMENSKENYCKSKTILKNTDELDLS